MHHGVLAAQPDDAESNVLDDGGSSLPMDLIAINQRVFEERRDRVNVVLGHFANVFEKKGERFKNTILDIELGYPSAQG